MKEITLTLNIDETNQILSALGKMPYFQVYELILKIQEQARPQAEDNNQEHPQAKDNKKELSEVHQKTHGDIPKQEKE